MRFALSTASFVVLTALLFLPPMNVGATSETPADLSSAKKAEPQKFLLVGFVKESKGAVSSDQTGLERPLIPGSAIVFKDSVVIGSDGMATINFIDGTTLKLGPDTVFRVDQLGFRSGFDGASIALEKGTLNLVPGKIASDTKGRILVQTPAAMVHAQGPVMLTHTGGLSTVTLTGEGKVNVTTNKGNTLLDKVDAKVTASVPVKPAG